MEGEKGRVASLFADFLLETDFYLDRPTPGEITQEVLKRYETISGPLPGSASLRMKKQEDDPE